tara:strand:+ start:92 stop:856 length:765 start_codon:yes stop_codon:yes gene_type:complete
MKQYINSLIGRVSGFSESLNNQALIINQPWILIDLDIGKQKFIFRDNNEILISFRGNVLTAKWEYLSSMKSVIIDREGQKTLLNQAYLDSAVMILQVDDTADEYFIFANESILPSLDVKGHLMEVMRKKLNIEILQLNDSRVIEIIPLKGEGIGIGSRVKVDGVQASDGRYYSIAHNKSFGVKAGSIVKIYFRKEYEQWDGSHILIELEKESRIQKNDLVYLAGDPAPDGQYRTGRATAVKTLNGVVKKVISFL